MFCWRIMSNYSEKQLEEFEELHRGVLRIKENLKTDFYLKKPFAQRGEIIIEDAKCLRKYREEVPLDVKESYRRKERVNTGKLTDKLFEVKNK